MDESKVTGFVVSTETGERTHELHKGDRIVRGKSVDAMAQKLKEQEKRAQDLLEWNLENFLKAYVAEMKLWMDDLTGTEKIFLFSIVPYISYDDCHLQHSNGVDIGTEDLVTVTGLSRPVVYDCISSLIKKDILYKGKNSKNRQYFVNPWLFCKGNRVSKVLRTMFKNYKIRVLGGKKWKDL
jgi:hypothetical protein